MFCPYWPAAAEEAPLIPLSCQNALLLFLLPTPNTSPLVSENLLSSSPRWNGRPLFRCILKAHLGWWEAIELNMKEMVFLHEDRALRSSPWVYKQEGFTLDRNTWKLQTHHGGACNGSQLFLSGWVDLEQYFSMKLESFKGDGSFCLKIYT